MSSRFGEGIALEDRDRVALETEAQALRQSGALGRSPLLHALFGYLVDASLARRIPKEIEIATEVFGRPPDLDTTQDAAIRVNIHRLRKIIAAYYRKRPSHRPFLILPRGQYRIDVAWNGDESAADEDATPDRPRLPRWALALMACALVAMSVLTTWAVMRPNAEQRELEQLRKSPLWAPLLDNDLPTLVVVGDHYMVGDSDDGRSVARLVREFSVGSGADLKRFARRHPERAARYVDLDLRYLPTSAGPALGRIVPALGMLGGTRDLCIILASSLTPAMLKTNNILYIGYLSGMGSLKQSAFATSRFASGSFDEIVDRRSGRRYASQALASSGQPGTYLDYGLLSTFRGPEGNAIMIIAGTRDVAVQQMADMLTTTEGAGEAFDKAGREPAFEALYQVSGMSRTNVTGKLIAASPMKGSGPAY